MKKILVVDDDTSMLEFLGAVLTTQDYSVHTDTNAKRGLAWVRDNQPDLVITDIFMPDMDGFEFIKSIRKFNNDTKILAASSGSSGLSRGFTLETARDFGADAVLEKPLKQEALLKLVGEMLDA